MKWINEIHVIINLIFLDESIISIIFPFFVFCTESSASTTDAYNIAICNVKNKLEH